MQTTAVDIEQFRTEGWFVVDGVFTAAECDEILGHVEQAALDIALGDRDDGPLSYRPMMHVTSPTLQAVACDRRWGPVVMPLLGDDVRLYWEQAVAKPPQARTELPWHQDNGYTPTIPEEYVTCWLALDDANEENGCIWVRPGSHLQGTLQHHDGSGPFRVGYDGPDRGVAVPIRRGSVLVFSSLIMHRSGPNVTDRPRRAWILQYCVADARSALSGKPLDDRLLVARDGAWLDEPVRERDLDLLSMLANYQRG